MITVTVSSRIRARNAESSRVDLAELDGGIDLLRCLTARCLSPSFNPHCQSRMAQLADSMPGSFKGQCTDTYGGRKNMSTIRLCIHIVYLSQKNRVDMFYYLNQDDSIYLQFMI
jgi:hypothetical protein